MSTARTRARPDLGPLLRQGVVLPRAAAPRPGDADAVLGPAEDLATHQGRLEPRPAGGPQLLAAVRRSGLTGRGGAGFPAARKWAAAARAGGPVTVVANAAESETLSGKDAALLCQRPHLVLDGLAMAAQTVRASRAVLWLHRGDTVTLARVHQALEQRRGTGQQDPQIEVVVGPAHYLAGESSAIGRALAGGPALPAFRLPFGALEDGGRRPARVPAAAAPVTLVHNVETLARVALIARWSGSGSAVGERQGPVATTLVTVLTATDRRVAEIPDGTELTEVLARVGWAQGTPAAVLLGGFGGIWAPWAEVAGLPLHRGLLGGPGISLGAGVLAPLPQGGCGLTETAAVLDYLAASSARQCGPCVFGLPALAGSMGQLTGGGGRRPRWQLDRDLTAVAGRGACHHPDGATALVASCLRTFADDADRHRRRRPCAGSAGPHYLPVPAGPQ